MKKLLTMFSKILQLNEDYIKDLPLNDLCKLINSKFKSFGLDFKIEDLNLKQLNQLEQVILVSVECLNVKLDVGYKYNLGFGFTAHCFNVDLKNYTNEKHNYYYIMIICNIISSTFINNIYIKNELIRFKKKLIKVWSYLQTVEKSKLYLNERLRETLELLRKYNKNNKYKHIESFEKECNKLYIHIDTYKLIQTDFIDFKRRGISRLSRL